MRRLLLFIPVVLAIILGVVLFAGIGKDTSHLESALIGKPVPSFELTDLQAPEELLNEHVFIGEVVLLNVWGTWCPACRDEHAELVRLAGDEGVRIIGLNYKDERDLALQWLQQLGNPYAITMYDPAGRMGFDLGVYGAPETYVIDGDGIVRFRHVGVVTEQVWHEKLQPVMRQYQERG